jgi:Phosphodiester glycosidase
MAKLIHLLLALLLVGCATPERTHIPAEIARYVPGDFQSPVASEAGRALERQKLRDALAAAQRPEATAAEIKTALTAMQLQQAELAQAPALLARLFDEGFAALPPSEQHGRLVLAHGLAPGQVAAQLAPQLARIATPREFAAAASVLLSADAKSLDAIRPLLAARSDGDDPRLQALRLRLEGPPPANPPLADWFAKTWMPGHPVVYSLQRRDRRLPGLAIVRGADGRFVREPSGALFAVRQLAFAASNLPGTISLGNTPQGLFSVVGAEVAESNPWIGPTPFLYSKVPVEATLAEFFHGAQPEAPWTREHYAAALPPRWRAHAPVFEAWLAGQAGRSEMLAHGMTQDPAWYASLPWSSLAPSAGCLVALETWSSDGRGAQSDQLRLLQAFTQGGEKRGFLVVLELDDAPRPVQLADVAAALREVGEQLDWQAIAYGLDYRAPEPGVHALRIDLQRLRIRLSPEAEKGLPIDQRPAARAALAAFNASFFDRSFRARGFTVSEGQTWSEPLSAQESPLIACDAQQACAMQLQPPYTLPAGTHTAVAGTPWLIRAGQPRGEADDATCASFCARLHPRTALGLSADARTLFLLQIEGRREDRPGATLARTAALLRSLGAHEALNLDGGGSSALLLQGQSRMQRPANEPGQRGLANVMVVER